MAGKLGQEVSRALEKLGKAPHTVRGKRVSCSHSNCGVDSASRRLVSRSISKRADLLLLSRPSINPSRRALSMPSAYLPFFPPFPLTNHHSPRPFRRRLRPLSFAHLSEQTSSNSLGFSSRSLFLSFFGFFARLLFSHRRC